MHRLIIIPWLCGLSLLGCWNFDALTNNSSNGNGDMAVCPKQKTTIREICNNNEDDNDDCLTDCADPQCYLECNTQPNQFIGYGSLIDKAMDCAANAAAPMIYQGANSDSDCSAGCTCKTPNTNWTCSSTLHWYSSMDCSGAEIASAAMSVNNGASNPACKDFGASAPMADSRFVLDPVGSNCAAQTVAGQKGTLKPAWAQEKKLCTQAMPCITLDCMREAKATCIAFTGDFATCPAQFPIRINDWYKVVTDNRDCPCSCSDGAGSCGITNNQVQFHDGTSCGGTATPLTSNSCAAPGGVVKKSIAFQPQPVCVGKGTVANSNSVTRTGQVTTCCTP